MKITRYFNLFFLVAALCLAGCSKTGPAGPQGPQGEQGDQGLQGIPGADGSTIYSDNGQPVADIGKNGDYYLDKSTGDLYGPKTDNGWGDPVSLKGPKGDKGDSGPQGSKGDKGATGATGPQGAKGEKGDPGQDGKDGSQIFSGTSTPSASAGNIGDYYWNTTTFTLYGPKTASGWGNGIGLRGPQGPKGEKGDKGDPGTANVMYSDWLTFKWGNSFPNEDLMYIKEPKITSDFINNGGIILSYLLFLQTMGKDTLTAAMYSIPQAIPSNNIGYAAGRKFNFSVIYYANSSHNIILDITSEDALPPDFLQDFLFVPDPVNPLYNRYRFRYILIPGGVHLRRSSLPPDPKNYKATCKYYGIPE